MCQYGDVRMIGYVQVEMCEWSGHNVRVIMKCATDCLCAVRIEMCEWSGHTVRAIMECANRVMCE